MADSAILYGLIKVFFPQLHDFFVRNNYEALVTNFVHKWFVSLFTQSFNEDTVDFILDMLFLEGNCVLIQSALSIFFLLEKNIIGIGKSIQGLFQILNNHNDIINLVLLYPFFRNNIFKFPNDHLDYIRKEIKPSILEIFYISQDVTLIEIKMDYNGKCNTRYPFCLKSPSIEIHKSGVEFLVYSIGNKVNIIHDYFDDYKKCNSNINANSNIKEEDEDSHFDVIAERRKHNCDANNNNERSLSRDYGFNKKDRVFTYLRNSKTMKYADRESIINNRLSKLHLVAEEKFDELMSHFSNKRIGNCSNSMYIYGNELSICSKSSVR